MATYGDFGATYGSNTGTYADLFVEDLSAVTWHTFDGASRARSFDDGGLFQPGGDE